MFTLSLASSITYFKGKETKSCCCRQLLQTSTKSLSRICCSSSPAPDTTQGSMRLNWIQHTSWKKIKKREEKEKKKKENFALL